MKWIDIMLPDPRFRNLPQTFWANVRTIGEMGGYTYKKQVKVHTIKTMIDALKKAGLGVAHIFDEASESPTELGLTLLDYFEYRAGVLNNYVEPRLMDAARARALFYNLKERMNPSAPLPMNKQTGEKAAPAYLTGIVNMLMEEAVGGLPCNYSPRGLTTFTHNGAPLRTLARRVDGCFPSIVDPIGIWEIKEYYYTTSFGSRIADGVYETLVDGLELQELREHEGRDCRHLLIVDAYLTWWQMGKSYLCRMIDLLHMGHVGEILFGYEVVERLPAIVAEWTDLYYNDQRRQRVLGTENVRTSQDSPELEDRADNPTEERKQGP
jgi:hypothetical protein